MPRRKPRFQSRLSRSARMQSAAVKRALEAQVDTNGPSASGRGGVRYVGPSPETDAVLAGLTAAYSRAATVELAWLLGIMAVVAAAMVLVTAPNGESLPFSPTTVNMLLILAAVTVVLGILIVLRRRSQGQRIASQLPAGQRRFELVEGTLRVQDRLNADNAHEYWLRASGSDWMPIDRSTFGRLQPLLVGSQRDDLAIRLRSENDVAHDWTIPNATVLFHRRTRTVVEIRDAEEELAYRHPRYQPTE